MHRSTDVMKIGIKIAELMNSKEIFWEIIGKFKSKKQKL
jgi:hypothetical protein